ncbi:MAG: CoA transferase [Rhodobacteraceae bacterium]|jgi:crotonobetainyl-CoA:carnitine CoA-transferase CaiB-like acyl-CoA transferase|nr:CoA transferase [Paracoccaceae bacterium]MAT01166.1 CoA transferase [Paracoccaceae bacterium]MDG1880245.1 CaiB/BaiF CoA-transferase family protein [Paracoccaceae bacterium]MDG1940152.1 CaiB/BaiF CoA-transferase family protein [Paracoccaceae bacterium]|tara:strand:- start:4703 stop:5842 length:1140 start_codon:yes stop_codon:yes gene_type:complete
MNHPLDGLKVVELARILAGPWAGQTLSDLGAKVIKVESLEGDDTRQWGPPFVTNGDDKSASYFHSCNRGKKSICVDFKSNDGQKTIKKLISEADILIENFKVGGLLKYGLDFNSLSKINPKLIYCSITGFGQTGPYSHRAGYDYIIQGMSGLMSITGEPDGQPQKMGVAVTDILTGLYGVTAILSAIIQRDKTGRGQHIDLALLDVATSVTANQAMNYLTTGTVPKRMGNGHQNLAPYQVFDCNDGHIIIATGNDAQYQRLCAVLELDEMASNKLFLKNADRLENRVALIEILNTETKKRTKESLLESCESQGIPAGPINDLSEVFEDPQVIFRGLVKEIDNIPTVASPFNFSDSSMNITNLSPKLGEHTDEILASLKK